MAYDTTKYNNLKKRYVPKFEAIPTKYVFIVTVTQFFLNHV